MSTSSSEHNLRTVSVGVEEDAVGCLIINADDWGYDFDTTSRTLECIRCGAVSSVSAMVFMRDSERAAAVALEHGIDCGLHLNFTSPFSANNSSSRSSDHQGRVRRYLRSNKLAQTIYHPGLVSSFRYVVSAQIEEFERVYGKAPSRIDGHHHMHLCANVVLGGLLPAGTQVRRNFSFRPGEKSGINRRYRAFIDRKLSKRHRLTDYFFSLLPIEPSSRIESVFLLAQRSVVEVETHPFNGVEYKFLTSGEVQRSIGHLHMSHGFNAHGDRYLIAKDLKSVNTNA